LRSDNINYVESILLLPMFVEFTNCTSLVTNQAPKGDQRLWYGHHRWCKPILVKMSDTGAKRQRPSRVWNYFLLKTLYILGEYSSTRVLV